jgi:YHS domain-containing protein
MIRHVFIFLATFVAGAVIALVVRAASFRPQAGHVGQPTEGGQYSAMVTNPLTAPNPPVAAPPSAPRAPVAASSAAPDPHAGHGAPAAAAPAVAGRPVNSLCAICGMDVDPKLPTAQYQGKTIGFGCKMCPPKFKADPDRYGPYYLRNEVIKH